MRLSYYNNSSSSRIIQIHSILPVSYTHLRAHETPEHLVCRLLLEKKKYNVVDSEQVDQALAFLFYFFFFLMIRRPPRSTRVRSSAASDVYKRQSSSRIIQIHSIL